MEKADKKTVTVSTGEILYWLFFGSLLFAKGIGLYDGQAVFKVILLFASCCLIAKLLIEEYTTAEYGKIVAVLGITALTYLVSGEKGLLLYGMMMVGMKNVNLKRVFTLGTIIWSVTFLGTTVSSLFRMDSTVYKVHAKLGLGHIFRWSLGYPHPNVLQVSYLLLAIFIIYMLGDKFRIKHAIWLFAGNCLVFLYSVSYTGIIVCLILIAGRVYLLYRKRLGKVEEIILLMIYPVCILLSLVAPVVLKGRWFEILNKILNTRLGLAQKYLQWQYISPFGVRVSEITSETMTMDNSYLFAFITYGVVPFIIVSLFIVYTIKCYLREKKYTELLLMVTIAIGGLTEPFLFNASFKNITFLFMGIILYKEKSGKKVYSIIPQELCRKINKERNLCRYRFRSAENLVKGLGQFSMKAAGAAAVCAIVATCSAERLRIYPEGYVIDRVNCADITEEKHYYQVGQEYSGYKEMREFQDGDEVEYFNGNIVLMERIRDGAIVCISSYAVSYVIIMYILKKRKERTC